MIMKEEATGKHQNLRQLRLISASATRNGLAFSRAIKISPTEKKTDEFKLTGCPDLWNCNGAGSRTNKVVTRKLREH